MRFTTKSHRFMLMFTLLLGGLLPLAGCSDSPTDGNDDTGNDNTPQTITSENYIQAKVDGKYKTVQQESISATQERGMGYSSHEGDLDEGYGVSHTTFFATVSVTAAGPSIDRKETFAITFIGIFDENPWEDEDYAPLITQGAMPFGSDSEKKEGVEVRWVDENNKEWSTAFGSGDQTGSAFQVTSKKTIEYPQPWLGEYVLYKVEGNFHCTLYDKEGNSMTVTNGKFSIGSVLR